VCWDEICKFSGEHRGANGARPDPALHGEQVIERHVASGDPPNPWCGTGPDSPPRAGHTASRGMHRSSTKHRGARFGPLPRFGG
jgi:hypothetical protein